MIDQTPQLKQLIAANAAETQRTPFLDVARGALQTAIDSYAQHTAALAAQAAAAPARLKALEEQAAALKAQIAAQSAAKPA
jgi:hypothetical protein